MTVRRQRKPNVRIIAKMRGQMARLFRRVLLSARDSTSTDMLGSLLLGSIGESPTHIGAGLCTLPSLVWHHRETIDAPGTTWRCPVWMNPPAEYHPGRRAGRECRREHLGRRRWCKGMWSWPASRSHNQVRDVCAASACAGGARGEREGGEGVRWRAGRRGRGQE